MEITSRAGEPGIRSMLVLKRGCRPLLAEPKGERLERPESIGRITICVGDRVTREFWSAGLRPEVCVVDLREERRRVSLEIPPGYTLTTVDNPRGAISPDAWRAVSYTHLTLPTTERV